MDTIFFFFSHELCFTVEIDECLYNTTCSGFSGCVNVIGSYFCLPLVTQIIGAENISLSGGNDIQLTFLFPAGTHFQGFDSLINDTYTLGLTYGELDWLFVNYSWEYDLSSAELYLNVSSSPGDCLKYAHRYHTLVF